MKIVKRILIVLAIVIALVLVIGLFMPRQVHMERSMLMKAPAKYAFDQVNTLKNWPNWSPWSKLDPKMVVTYSGPSSGKDARYDWTSEKGDVGNGSLTIVESIPDSLVKTEMDFKGHGKGTSSFTFNKTLDGTKVTWSFDSDMGMNPLMHIMGAMMDGMMGKSFDAGLTAMKDIVEKMPAMPTSNYKVEETTSQDMHILTMNYKGPSTSAEIGKACKDAYGKISEYIKKNNLKGVGSAFAIYNNFSASTVDMDPGMAVDQPAKGEGDIKASEMKAGNALKVSYMGPYSGLGGVHMAINQYAKDHNKQIAGAPWEVYVSDPMTEKDSTKYMTEVYYPVK